jgi:hypothetical protein
MKIRTLVHDLTGKDRILRWADKNGKCIDADGWVLLEGAYPVSCRETQAVAALKAEINGGASEIFLVTDIDTIKSTSDSIEDIIRGVSTGQTANGLPAITPIKKEKQLIEFNNRLVELRAKAEEDRKKVAIEVAKNTGDEPFNGVGNTVIKAEPAVNILNDAFIAVGAMEDFKGGLNALTPADKTENANIPEVVQAFPDAQAFTKDADKGNVFETDDKTDNAFAKSIFKKGRNKKTNKES